MNSVWMQIRSSVNILSDFIIEIPTLNVYEVYTGYIKSGCKMLISDICLAARNGWFAVHVYAVISIFMPLEFIWRQPLNNLNVLVIISQQTWLI